MKVKDIYGDTIEVEHGANGSVVLTCNEADPAEPGRVELILGNDARRKLRKALKRA